MIKKSNKKKSSPKNGLDTNIKQEKNWYAARGRKEFN
jgi:hypothetical protein